MNHGTLFIISAPSGAGKTTILKKILSLVANLTFSVSHTTRPPRSGEQDGVDYFFVSKDAFSALLREDFFLEWAEVHGNLYGTSRTAVQSGTDQGLDVVLDIDVQGARQVRKRSVDKNIFIFIAPPSLAELEKRLSGRFTESAADIAERLANAREEIKSIGDYDYVIVNDTVDRAVEVLKSIIIAERSRKRRDISGKPINLKAIIKNSPNNNGNRKI